MRLTLGNETHWAEIDETRGEDRWEIVWQNGARWIRELWIDDTIDCEICGAAQAVDYLHEHQEECLLDLTANRERDEHERSCNSLHVPDLANVFII